MLKVLTNRRVRNFEEAVTLAFEEAGIDDTAIEVTSLFASALDANRLSDEGDKSIKSTVHNKYGKKATPRYSTQWFVPVPWLGFKTEPIPQLIITIQPYLVAPVRVPINDYSSYSLTLVGVVDRAVELAVPMVFLHAIINDDLGRFRLVAKNSSHTTWEVPSAKPVELPNDFVDRLSETLKRKSVVMCLESFGSQGRTVAPQVVGSLLGLQSMGTAQPIPTGQQAWSRELIINALVGSMDYKTKEADEMFNHAAPYLRAEHTLEEAIRTVLQQGGKGEY